MTRGFLSRHWLVFLHQCLHNDHWRTSFPTHADVDPDLIGGRLSDPANSSPQGMAHLASNPPIHPLNKYAQAKTSSASTSAQNSTRALPQTTDPTIFFAGLIKTLWDALSKLWKDHLDLIHETATATSSPVSRSDITIRIRSLAAQQPMVLPIHRTSRYFPADLDAFLTTSSLSQLQNYVAQYGPVIQSSILQQQELLETATILVAGGHSATPIPATGIPLTPHTTRDRTDLDSQSEPQSPSQHSELPVNIHSDTESDDDLLPLSSTGHPALEEATHRKSRGHRIHRPAASNSQD